MRRRPVAVYRVIDEEELLGRDGVELVGGECELLPASGFAAGDMRDRLPGRDYVRSWSGWRSTTLGVVALACVAALLLSVSSRVAAPVTAPAVSPPGRPAAPTHVAVAVVAPARRPQRRPRTPEKVLRPARPAPHRPTRQAQPAIARASPLTVAPARRVAMRARRSPDLEFGFER
jgi:hypothetical protein